jgi:hypothetical protein
MSVSVKFVATAQCEHEAKGRGCTESLSIECEASEMSAVNFSLNAQNQFLDLGWQFFGGTRCPRHAKRTARRQFKSLAR